MKYTLSSVRHLMPIILVLTLTSCSVSYLTVTDAVIPAKYALPVDIKTVVIMNRSAEKDIVERISSDKILNAHHKELMRHVAGRLPFHAVAHKKKGRDSWNGEAADALKSDEVRELGAGYDGLLCLERAHHEEQRTYENYSKHQLDDQGADYYVDAVRGSRRQTLHALLATP